MNLKQVKKQIYNITELFFSQATVAWAEQVMTKPPVPYITLKMGNIQKESFPFTDDADNRNYLCNTIMELNLYTKGRPISAENGVISNYENTATDDLMEFVKFLESDTIVDLLADLSIELNPPVRDLTELLNDAKYRYRAMAEFTVSYTEQASGKYGITNIPQLPNSSGGGSEELVVETEFFDSVKIIEVKEDTDGS